MLVRAVAGANIGGGAIGEVDQDVAVAPREEDPFAEMEKALLNGGAHTSQEADYEAFLESF